MQKFIIFLSGVLMTACLLSCSPTLEETYSNEVKEMHDELSTDSIMLYNAQLDWLQSIKEVITYDIVREMSPHFGMQVPAWVNSRYVKWLYYAEMEKEDILSDEMFYQEKDVFYMERYLQMYGKLGMSTFLKSYRLEKNRDLSAEQRQFCDSVIQVVIQKYPVPRK